MVKRESHLYLELQKYFKMMYFFDGVSTLYFFDKGRFIT
jgi:hypothetical protein